MISLYTNPKGDRTYSVPVAVAAVARHLFGGVDLRQAVFRLARGLRADDLATLENIATLNGHRAAVKFARERWVGTRWHRTPATQ